MKNVVGLFASGAATLGLIISIGIWDTTDEWNVLVWKPACFGYFLSPLLIILDAT